MRTPLWIIDHARTCLYSSLAMKHNRASGLPEEPDYTCNLTDPHFTKQNEATDDTIGKPCRLLTHGDCPKREQFPHRHDF